MKKVLFTIGIVALALTANAQNSVWKAQDAESPVLIKYVGTQDNPTITVGTGSTAAACSVTLSTDGDTNVCSGVTVAALIAAINAATDTDSTTNNYVYPWKAIQWGAIGTDVFSNNVIAVTATAVSPQEWSTLVKWDTSQTKTFDAVVSGVLGNSKIGGQFVTDIFGDAGGTGNCTISLYENDTVKYTRVIPAVNGWYYDAASNIVATTTAGNFPASGLSLGTGIYIGQGKIGHVRAAMSTTATTGGIGATTKQRGE